MEIISPAKPGKSLMVGINRLAAQLGDTAHAVSVDRISRIIDSENIHLLVAVDQGVVLGMLTLVLYLIPTATRAVIEDVVVDSSARGRGVGRALVHRALVRAEALGADTVALTSAPWRDAANRLYSRMGFEKRETNVYRYVLRRDG